MSRSAAMLLETSRIASAPPAAGGERILRRSRALPGGRAVVGALLIAVAGLGAFTMARRADATPDTSWVIVTHAVAPGARLTADDLALRPMRLDPDVAANAYGSLAGLEGAVALAPLGAGQLLARASVAPRTSAGPDGLAPAHELTLPVPVDRMPTGLRRGESVAVLATYGTGNDARTVVTVQRAVVLAVGDPGDGLTTRGTARLTVSLPDPAAVIETAHAAQVAELTVVRATQTDATLPESFATEALRAGATTTTSPRSGS